MGSALDGATRTIEQFGNIIARGPAINSNTEFNVMMEHSQSAGATGKGKASTRTTMQASLRALGTIDGVNFSTATATDSALKILVGDVLAPSALENPDLS